MIKLNEIYSKFESILPANIKKEIEDKNANGVTEPKYWQVGDFFVEYINKKVFPSMHIPNGNPIFLQMFKITEEWCLVSRFMKIKTLPTDEKEKEYFKMSLENNTKKVIIYLLIEIKESNETTEHIMYCPGSPENPLDFDYPYYQKIDPYLAIKKVCVEDAETRKALLEMFALRYDIDLNKDKVFKSLDLIFSTVNEILSK